MRSSTAAASKTEKTSSEPLGGRTSTTVEYGNELERIERRRAQGHCPPRDARTRAGAFNALVTFPPNTLVTGSVIGNRHPSRHSFCSLPHLTTRSMSGRRKPGWNVKSGPPRDIQGQRFGQQGTARRLTLDQTWFLPGEELGIDWQHRSHSARSAAIPYRRATGDLARDGAQSRIQGHA